MQNVAQITVTLQVSFRDQFSPKHYFGVMINEGPGKKTNWTPRWGLMITLSMVNKQPSVNKQFLRRLVKFLAIYLVKVKQLTK